MASRGVNKVILVGNLGKNPEVRYTPDGRAITNITVATSETWKDKNTGQPQEKTEWHRVIIFGKLAEIAGEYLSKGSQVYLEGKLQTRKWQDQSGADRYTTEITLDPFSGVMQMLGGRTSNNSNNERQSNLRSTDSQQSQQAPKRQAQPKPLADDDFDDDIPF